MYYGTNYKLHIKYLRQLHTYLKEIDQCTYTMNINIQNYE